MRSRTLATCLCVLAAPLVLPLPALRAQRATPAPQAPPPPSRAAIARFAADVTVQRAFLDAEGRQTGNPPPGVRYRLERSRARGVWKTVLHIVGPTQAPTLLANGTMQDVPARIERIEDDGDGTPPRVYGRGGRLLQFPSPPGRLPADFATITGRQPTDVPALSRAETRLPNSDDAWLESLMPGAQGAATRRAAIERRYGRALGTVRGLDRFVTTTPDVTAEILVDPALAVPIEMNVVRGGRLDSHTGFTYVRTDGGGIFRQRVRREQRVVGARADTRLATDVTFSNVTIGTGGAQ